MAENDWFRNSDWSPAIETRFFENLRRARRKGQYLLVQAGHLEQSRPEVALTLLERYFQLGKGFDLAQAFVVQARAYLSLGNVAKALKSYESALEREHEYPTLRTCAGLELSMLVANHQIADQYAAALALLVQYKARIAFPVEEFQYYAARALISKEQGDSRRARKYALGALRAAEREHSGFLLPLKIGPGRKSV